MALDETARGTNLLDERGRRHTSFLKDYAPPDYLIDAVALDQLKVAMPWPWSPTGTSSATRISIASKRC